MQSTTVTLAEAAATEDAATEAIVDEAFAPAPPLTAQPPTWEVGPAYAKNALVTEAGIVYRSQEAANKGNKPSEDADFVHWAPIGVEIVPLQNPAFAHTSALVTQRTYASSPPARSDAAAPAAETVSPGPEVALR